MLKISCSRHVWNSGIAVSSVRSCLFLRNWSTTQVHLKAAPSASKAAAAADVVPRICETPPTNEPEKPPAVADASPTSRLQAYMMLSKFRLTSLVVMTSMSGYAMAPGVFDLPTVAMCAVGTGMMSAAANAVNQFFEVPFDSQMARTRNRLLVKSVVTPLHAFTFAMASATTGSALLYFGVNPLTAAIGFANLFLYTSVYTPLKRVSIINTWVGSIVGALPPLMGWAGCTGALEPGAWVLAGILYAWQFPHFNALSWNLRPDYSRAGYRMMSVTNPALCRRTTLRYTALILGLSCYAPFVDLTNTWFALESLPLNGYFLYLAWKFYKESDSANSRKLFRFSLIQLPALMLLMLINKKKQSNVEDGTLPPATTSI
uniref:Protoheme IX farnesyltransferase, mitochondrial n=1 Tax=Lygus hesperus TaxID=30085 RepID=A0A0A9Y1Q1_LYGHE